MFEGGENWKVKSKAWMCPRTTTRSRGPGASVQPALSLSVL